MPLCNITYILIILILNIEYTHTLTYFSRFILGLSVVDVTTQSILQKQLHVHAFQ